MSYSTPIERLQDVWSRRRAVALIAFGVPLLVSFSLALFLPSVYRAEAMLVVERTSAGDRPQVEAVLHTLTEENLSRSHLRSLIKKHELYPELREVVPIEGLVERMRKDIEVEHEMVRQAWGTATIALSIGYLSSNPDKSAKVTQELATYYIEEDRQARKKQARQTLVSLKKRINLLRKQLAQEEARISDFMLQYRTELPEQVGVNLAAIERLNARLRENREAQVEVLTEIRGLSGAPTPASDSDDTVATTRVALERRLAQLRARFTDAHPDIRALKARFRALGYDVPQRGSAPGARRVGGSQAETSSGQTSSTQLSDKLRQLEEKEHELLSQIDAYTEQVRNAPVREQELESLLPSYETTRTRYRALLEEYGSAQLRYGSDAQELSSAFRLVDQATAPRSPAAPSRLRLLLQGSVVAILLAFAAVFTREKLDSSFHNIQDLRGFSKVPVVGVLPVITSPSELRWRRARATLLAVTSVVLGALLVAALYRYAHDNQQLVWMLAQRGF